MELIRPITKEDFEEWLPLWEMYNSFYKRNVSHQTNEETWKRFLDPQEPMFALVFEKDRKILGFTHYLFHRHTAMIHNACYLQDLFTLEAARGKGIGRKLIEEVSIRAKEAGSSNIYWMTHENNEVARKLYDKVAKNSGFIVYHKSFAAKKSDSSGDL